MIEVRFYSLEGAKAKRVFKGRITYDKGELKAYPAKKHNEGLMKFILNEPIITPAGDVYDPESEPEDWINNLHAQYRSYGLTASRPTTI